jgi:hypothetical protein
VVRTPATPAEALAAIRQALSSYPDATSQQLPLLWAQSSLETDRWRKMYGNNMGNLVAGSGWSGPTIMLRDGGADRAFRAYPDLTAGAADYVRLIHSRPAWWAGSQTGDPIAYAHALTEAPAYYEADPSRYARGMQARLAEFQGNPPIAPSLAMPMLAGAMVWALSRRRRSY